MECLQYLTATNKEHSNLKVLNLVINGMPSILLDGTIL